MSKSEDYLDNLLSAVSTKGGGKAGSTVSMKEAERIMDPDKAFLDEFEKQLLDDDGDDDEFLRDFEMELQGDGGTTQNDTSDDEQGLIENLDGIVNSAKQKMEEKTDEVEDVNEDASEDEESEFVVDTLDDEAKAMINSNGSGDDSFDDVGFGDDFSEFGIEDDINFDDETSDLDEINEGNNQPESGDDAEDDDLMSLLKSEDDLADIGNMLKESQEEAPAAEGEDSTDEKKKDKKEKNGKDSGEKKGFFAKLGRILFGEDEEEELPEQANAEATQTPEFEKIDGVSDENMDILKQLEGGASSAPAKEEEEDKKGKKDKKKKEKKPKEKKEKKPKVKKEKKPKPPKEKDNTPPLPKAPVILMFVMAASFMLLVILGSNLINYTSAVNLAQESFDSGDYIGAYTQMSGLKVKEKDNALYEETKILASVSSQYQAAQAFIENEDYDMALDSLICAIGRFDINYPNAELYNCTVELKLVEQEVENSLTAQFGLTADQARELYAIRSREDYSIEVYKIIQNLGLEKVTEE